MDKTLQMTARSGAEPSLSPEQKYRAASVRASGGTSIIVPRATDLNAAYRQDGSKQARWHWTGVEFCRAVVFALVLAVAWRHGLSQSPWAIAFKEVAETTTMTPPRVSKAVDTLSLGGVVLSPSAMPGLVAEQRKPLSISPEHISPEQRRLVDFITQRYRAASDLVHEIVSETYAIAREHKIDPLLILAMVAVESQFDPFAQSPRGAQGLMQILTRVHVARFEQLGGVAAVFDPVTNLRVGVGILKEYLGRDGNIEQALKTYVGAANLPSDHGYGQRVMLARSKFEEAAKSPGR